MAYKYLITLTLADRSKMEAINLRDYSNDFMAAMRSYNVAAMRGRNKKSILSVDVSEKKLDVLLSSENPLDIPTHALREYSVILARDASKFATAAVTNKKLFRGEYRSVDDSEHVSNPEIIKLFVELIYGDRPQDRALIGEMKDKLLKWRKEINA